MVGAGGKTTLVYRLAAEARAGGLRVLVTTTTHMGTLPEATTGHVLVEAEGDTAEAVRAALRDEGMATLLGRRVRSDKLEGILPSHVDALAVAADLVLVEADGARGRSLKVPGPHEPVLPSSTTAVVVVAGLDAVGEPLAEERVHRLDLVVAAAGATPGDLVTAPLLARVLAAPGGYVSRVPPGVRSLVFLNKAESPDAWAAAERAASALVPPYARVAAGGAREGPFRVLAGS